MQCRTKKLNSSVYSCCWQYCRAVINLEKISNSRDGWDTAELAVESKIKSDYTKRRDKIISHSLKADTVLGGFPCKRSSWGSWRSQLCKPVWIHTTAVFTLGRGKHGVCQQMVETEPLKLYLPHHRACITKKHCWVSNPKMMIFDIGFQVCCPKHGTKHLPLSLLRITVSFKDYFLQWALALSSFTA